MRPSVPARAPDSVGEQRHVQLPDPSDWIVVVLRALVLITLALITLRGWVSSPFGAWVPGAILSAALFYNGIALFAHRRGVALRFTSLIVDAIWMGLWMFTVGERASNFFPLFILLTVMAGMWFRVIGAVLMATCVTLFYLMLVGVVYRLPLIEFQWALVRDVAFLFLIALLAGYMAEARIHEERERLQAERIIDQYRRDMLISNHLYRFMTPQNVPQIKSWQLARYTRPARMIAGGDFHDFIKLNNDGWAIVIGDVSGKGIDAQVKVPLVKFAVRVALHVSDELSDGLRMANGILVNEFNIEEFVTLAVVRITSSGVVDIANAGHVPTVIVRTNGKVEHIAASGPPLGIMNDVCYTHQRIELAPSELLLLVSDGVIGARNANGEEYGLERLVNSLTETGNKSTTELVEKLAEAVTSFEAPGTGDDITILIARFVG